MLDLSYLGEKIYPVKDKNDFYKSGLKECISIRGIISACRRIFIVPDNRVNLSVVGNIGAYRIDVLEDKTIIGRVYYFPKDKRIDIYTDGNSTTPFVSWKSKKCVWKNYPLLLQKLKLENLFLPIIMLV